MIAHGNRCERVATEVRGFLAREWTLLAILRRAMKLIRHFEQGHTFMVV